MRSSRHTKSTRTGSLELVQNGTLDALENKVTQLLKSLQDAQSENARLRGRLAESGSPDKDKTVDEKENIIRRQQVMLKSKEAAFQELQNAFSEQSRQIEALTSGNGSSTQTYEAPAMDDTARDGIRNKLESVMQKLDQLEKIIH